MTMLSFRCTAVEAAEIRHRAEVLGMSIAAYLRACAAGPVTEVGPDLPQRPEGLPAIGDRVKDRISGFAGIVTALSVHMNGNRQATVDPETANAQGEVRQARWIDECRLVVLDRGAVDVPLEVGGLYL